MIPSPSPRGPFQKIRRSTDVKLQLRLLASCCCAEEVLISNLFSWLEQFTLFTHVGHYQFAFKLKLTDEILCQYRGISTVELALETIANLRVLRDTCQEDHQPNAARCTAEALKSTGETTRLLVRADSCHLAQLQRRSSDQVVSGQHRSAPIDASMQSRRYHASVVRGRRVVEAVFS